MSCKLTDTIESSSTSQKLGKKGRGRIGTDKEQREDRRRKGTRFSKLVRARQSQPKWISELHRCTSWHPTERNVGPHSSLKSEISHRVGVSKGQREIDV